MTQSVSEKQQMTSPLRYAFGMFGTSIPINMFKTYAAFFYIDYLGYINTPQFSLVLLIYTFIDAIDNPVYGYLSDCTRSKWGRRRPWLMIGAPLLVLCFILFFNPPAFIASNGLPYILLMYILTGTLDSLINANYGALFPELFKTEKSRARTNAIRQVFQLLAMIISIALTPVITDLIGFSWTAIIYGTIAVFVIWFMTLGAHEDPEAMNRPKPKLLESIRDILRNRKFWIYGITNASFFAAIGLIQSGIPFYVKYHLQQDSSATTILLGTFILSAILFIPVWVQIVNKLTLLPSWRLSLIIIAVTILPLYFSRSLLLSAATVVFVGFGMAGVSTTMDIVSARILDEDSEKHGVQREGIFSSLVGILNKSSGLFTALGFYLVYAVYGFESGDIPGSSPGDASRFLVVLFPAIVFAVAIAMSFHLKFRKVSPSLNEIKETINIKEE